MQWHQWNTFYPFTLALNINARKIKRYQHKKLFSCFSNKNRFYPNDILRIFILTINAVTIKKLNEHLSQDKRCQKIKTPSKDEGDFDKFMTSLHLTNNNTVYYRCTAGACTQKHSWKSVQIMDIIWSKHIGVQLNCLMVIMNMFHR